MNLLSSRAGKFVLVTAAVAIVAFALVRAVGAQGPHARVSMVSDWSHRHVIYSQPTSWATAWRLQGEARYWQQVVRRSGGGRGPVEPEFERGRFGFPGLGWREQAREKPIERDWGVSLGAGGSTGVPLAGTTWYPVYPAKFSFDVNATPDCTNDFVAFTTNLAGAKGGQASVVAYNKLYSGSVFSFCALALAPSVYWSYNTNFNAAGAATTGTVATSPVLSIDGSKLAFVENRTNANGGAILHLLKWNAGDGGAINTAANPTIATTWTADGAAGHCPVSGACLISLVLNGAQADTASSPYYDYKNDALYVGDDTGVLHKFINVFGLGVATPSEVTVSWPITVNTTANTILTSPVLDGVSGNIFTTDSSGTLSYVRETFSTAGTCKAGATPCLGSTTVVPPVGHVLPDAPLVDPVTEKVFIFFSNNGTEAAVVQSDITLSASVTASLGANQLNHHLHSGAFDNAYLTGNGSAGRLYMCGSSAGNIPTIQRIGFTNTGRTPASPFANPVGTMNAAVDAATVAVATSAVECAPLTEFFNANAPAATQDQIFFGVQSNGSGANCTAGVGCVMSINVTGIPTGLAILSSITEIGGPSGIIVDNDANTNTGNFPQASSLYFSNQGNSTAAVQCGTTTGVGCAIKLTQAGLN